MLCQGCRSSHCIYLELLLSLKHASRQMSDCSNTARMCFDALLQTFFCCNCRGTASPTRLGSLPDQKAQLSIGSPKVMTQQRAAHSQCCVVPPGCAVPAHNLLRQTSAMHL